MHLAASSNPKFTASPMRRLRPYPLNSEWTEGRVAG
jgi:hypothetical protein